MLMKSNCPDVYEPTAWHYIAVFPFFAIVRLLQMTVRLKTSADNQKILSSPERIVGIAWHSRIFFLAMCKYYYRDKIPMNGLVSASKDGAYLCAFFRLMGIGAIRGSHKRRGAGAVMELVEAIKSGEDVFITPDGPRGPKNKAKAGFALVSKESGARILALKITPNSYWRISKAWDNFIIPKPFSTARVDVLEFKSYDDLKKAADARNAEVQNIVEDYLNEDGID